MREIFYVVVYVGYEGIEHILHVTTDPEEAAAKVLEYRAIAREHARLDEEALSKLPYPSGIWTEPDRFCALTRRLDGEPYRCCCAPLGVSPEEQVLY